MTTIIDEYIELDKKYKQQCGPETVVFMEVGDFFEMYGVQNEFVTEGASLQDVSDILNIRITAKNKSNSQIDRKNPLMSGFPSYIVEKHIQTLVEHQYTVVIVEQYENKNCKYYKQFDRKVSRIITPSTYFNYHTESNNYANYLMVCYWETLLQTKDGMTKPCLSMGCSLVDISTGNTHFYECNDKDPSSTYTLEETYRIIQMFNPTEIIHSSLSSIDKNTQKTITDYLHSNNNIKIVERWNIDKIYQKVRYQEEMIRKSFSKYLSYISPIDTLKLEMKPLAVVSFCYMLQYVYEHDEKLVTNLLLPQELEKSRHMSIEYNSIQQLNIKNQNEGEKCLSKILNRCVTSFGKRKFWDWLINPITNNNELVERYTNTEFYIKDSLYEKLRKNLKLLCDVQKYTRKIIIERIVPSDWVILKNTFENIIHVYEIIQTKKEDKYSHQITQCKSVLEMLITVLNINECAKYNSLQEVKTNIFNTGINTEIDVLEITLIENFEFLNKLSTFIDNVSGEKEINKIEYNDKQGYSITITKKRWETFNEKLKQYYKKRENNYDISLDLTVFEYQKEGSDKKISVSKRKASIANTKLEIYSFDNIEFDFSSVNAKPISASSTNLRITSPKIEEISNSIVNIQQKIQQLTVTSFSEFLKDIMNKHDTNFQQIVQSVSEIDVYCTNAYNASEYSYTRPQLIQHDSSFFVAKDMRHPIIERINTQNRFVENDISLGCIPDDIEMNKNKKENTKSNGILLYGVNSSGKSTLMKSVGLNVIMAQAGMFVPCSSFVFSPYKHIFTRINGNDNIYKGMSSFTVEMTELKNILDRCNHHSLILGDELCSGTESVSALSIVASGILEILKRNGNFIFATHLHELCDIEVIKQHQEEQRIQVFHIHVSSDEKGNIIFDRKLTQGKGNSVYGLEICKYLKLPEEFLRNAETIRKQIMGVSMNLVEPKTSRYNTNLIVSSCGICGKIQNGGIPLDTHHIVYQQHEDEKGHVKINNTSFHKNQEHNLIPLCKDCHDKEHRGIIKIKGFQETSHGRKIIVEDKEDVNYENIHKSEMLKSEMIKSEMIKEIDKYVKKEQNSWKMRKSPRGRWIMTDKSDVIKFIEDKYKLSQNEICKFIQSQ